MKYTLLSSMVALAALSIPAGALAVPAFPGLRPFTQPDGTTVMLEARGDEHGHFFQDEQGRVVMRDATSGAFVYALAGDSQAEPLRSSGILAGTPLTAAQQALIGPRSAVLAEFSAGVAASRARSLGVADNAIDDTPVSAANITAGHSMRVGNKQLPCTGKPNIMVVLVEFPDVKFSMDDPVDYFNTFCNTTGHPGMGGSVQDYFRQSSYGVYEPQFEIVGPVKVSKESTYYGQNLGTVMQDAYLTEMIKETAVLANEALKAKGLDLSRYDLDADNTLDGLIIIYAGEGEAMSHQASHIWPCTSFLYTGSTTSKFEVDGMLIDGFSATCELMSIPTVQPAGPGVFVHEYSHLMGLPDFYPTDYVDTVTPDNWSVMDSGCYLGETYTGTPCLYSAYEAYCFDYIELTEVLSDQPGRLVAHSGEAYVIPQEGRTNEFYILEARAPQGWDSGFAGNGGLMIWHVDFYLTYWRRNTVNNDPAHPRMQLVRAVDDIEAYNLFPYRNRITEFTAATTPAFESWNGVASPINLHEIKWDSKTSTATFWMSTQVGLDTVEAADASNAPVEWFNLQGVRVANPGQGVYIRRQGDKVAKVVL